MTSPNYSLEKPVPLFTLHDETTASAEAANVLEGAKQRYGFIPNLAAYLAEAPHVLDAVLQLSAQFDNCSMTPEEQQLVMLTVSTINDCAYCKSAHTALAKAASVKPETIDAVLTMKPLADSRLEALREFTQSLVEEKGWINEASIERFLRAGFNKANVFEVVLGIALKTLTNYSNHLVRAEPNQEFLSMG